MWHELLEPFGAALFLFCVGLLVAGVVRGSRGLRRRRPLLTRVERVPTVAVPRVVLEDVRRLLARAADRDVVYGTEGEVRETWRVRVIETSRVEVYELLRGVDGALGRGR